MADGIPTDNDGVEVTLVISRATYERAKSLAAECDPAKSIMGDYAAMFQVEEFLGHFLDAHLEGTAR